VKFHQVELVLRKPTRKLCCLSFKPRALNRPNVVCLQGKTSKISVAFDDVVISRMSRSNQLLLFMCWLTCWRICACAIFQQCCPPLSGEGIQERFSDELKKKTGHFEVTCFMSYDLFVSHSLSKMPATLCSTPESLWLNTTLQRSNLNSVRCSLH